MRRAYLPLLTLLLACAPLAGQPFRHPPDIAATDLPTCDATRDGRLLSLKGATSSSDCTPTGGGTATALCHCEQTSPGVYGWVAAGSGGGGGASTDAEYVTTAADATLSAERVLGSGTNTTVTTGAGTVQIDVGDAATGAKGVVQLAGDLAGTAASPSVVDDSHAHTTTTISGLDVSADTNLAVTAPVVLTDDTLSLNQNAGTDVTADLEEETHASEHAENAADELLVEALGTACTDGQGFAANATGGVDCTNTGNAPVLFSSGSTAGAADVYLGLGADSTTEGDVEVTFPIATTLSDLYCEAQTAPGTSESWIMTLRKNGASTAVTCTISGTGSTCSDTTNSVTTAAGDELAIFADASAGAASTTLACGLSIPSGGGGGASATVSWVELSRTSNLTVSNVTDTPVSWDTEVYDTDGYHEGVTNPSRVTIPTGMGGVYAIQCSGGWLDDVSGQYQINIRKNGSTNIAVDRKFYDGTIASVGITTTATLDAALSASDYVECVAFQSSGATRTLQSGGSVSRMIVRRLGD